MIPAFFMYQYIVVERADADTRYSVIFFTFEAARTDYNYNTLSHIGNGSRKIFRGVCSTL